MSENPEPPPYEVIPTPGFPGRPQLTNGWEFAIRAIKPERRTDFYPKAPLRKGPGSFLLPFRVDGLVAAVEMHYRFEAGREAQIQAAELGAPEYRIYAPEGRVIIPVGEVREWMIHLPAGTEVQVNIDKWQWDLEGIARLTMPLVPPERLGNGTQALAELEERVAHKAARNSAAHASAHERTDGTAESPPYEMIPGSDEFDEPKYTNDWQCAWRHSMTIDRPDNFRGRLPAPTGPGHFRLPFCLLTMIKAMEVHYRFESGEEAEIQAIEEGAPVYRIFAPEGRVIIPVGDVHEWVVRVPGGTSVWVSLKKWQVDREKIARQPKREITPELLAQAKALVEERKRRRAAGTPLVLPEEVERWEAAKRWEATRDYATMPPEALVETLELVGKLDEERRAQAAEWQKERREWIAELRENSPDKNLFPDEPE